MIHKVNIRKLMHTLGMNDAQDPSALNGAAVSDIIVPVWDQSRTGNLVDCQAYIGQNEAVDAADLVTTYDMDTANPIWPDKKDMYIYSFGIDITITGAAAGQWTPILQDPGHASIDIAIGPEQTQEVYWTPGCFGFIFDDILPAGWHLGVKISGFGASAEARPIVIAKPIIRR